MEKAPVSALFTATVSFPFGKIQVFTQDSCLVRVSFKDNSQPDEPARHPLTQQVIDQLQAYFNEPYPKPFTIPLKLLGTPFQIRVWQGLQAIPSGQVLTYGQLAKRLDTGARAVGNACRANPIPLVVPCHRVVAVNQRLGGYSGQVTGQLTDMKRWLLKKEGVDF